MLRNLNISRPAVSFCTTEEKAYHSIKIRQEKPKSGTDTAVDKMGITTKQPSRPPGCLGRGW